MSPAVPAPPSWRVLVLFTCNGADLALSSRSPSTMKVASSSVWAPVDMAGSGALQSKSDDVGDEGGWHETPVSSARAPST